MSDPPQDKKISIPQWQRQSDSQPQEDPDPDPDPTPTSTAPPLSRATLLEQASKFLDEDDIKHAPKEKKAAFLEAKGLTKDDISKLLDITSESAGTPLPKVTGTEETVYHNPYVQFPRQYRLTPLKSNVPSSQVSQIETAPPSPASSSSAEKDTPPIITYPEFLIRSRKPPPLITASRLINAFYLFSGTAAVIYGTSKYIVDPMLESLTSARHSLFDTAQTNLETLNERLMKIVSTVPDGIENYSDRGDGADDDEDSSETTEDIMPLFNRTIGTQTSAPPSLSSSIPGSEPKSSPNPIPMHETSLKSLHSSLSALLAPSRSSDAESNLTSQIRDLKQYLDSLSYPSLYHPTTSSLAESKDDAVNKFKAEVRGVKGVLLSARNFPSGSGRAIG
ncbi:MAG: hypothetical protein Q9211_002921 [Gyalolechia sp. 1 TL-2023]